MNEIKFKNLDDIENYKIRFKCFDGSDGYQATFHIYDKLNFENHYQIDFVISETEYNSDTINSGKSTKMIIDVKYGNIENCFREIGTNHIKEKILQDNLKNEVVSLIRCLF